MTALILHTAPYAELVLLKLRAVGQQVISALDAFAEAKMRNAVPEHELRRSQREINRYHRIIHAPQAVARQRKRFASAMRSETRQ